MTKAEKCIAWFNENGVHAWSPDNDEEVMIMINCTEIKISMVMVVLTAFLYDNRKEVTNE